MTDSLGQSIPSACHTFYVEAPHKAFCVPQVHHRRPECITHHLHLNTSNRNNFICKTAHSDSPLCEALSALDDINHNLCICPKSVPAHAATQKKPPHGKLFLAHAMSKKVRQCASSKSGDTVIDCTYLSTASMFTTVHV